jgi:serine/threonine protein kinase
MTNLAPGPFALWRRLLWLGLLAWLTAGVPDLFAQEQPEPEPEAPPAPIHNPAGGGLRPPKKKGFDLLYVIVPVLGLGAIVAVVIVYLRQDRMRRSAAGESSEDENVIGGYRLLRHIVTGQTSQVWEVVQLASLRHFAMKILLPETAGDSEHRRLLFHEAEVGNKLAHPNIIRILSVSTHKKTPHFVMEFFPSGSLKLRVMHKEVDFIKEHVQEIFKQWATGLAYMNALGWVHRDVKPDNLLVNSSGVAKIIDFALAQRVQKGMLAKRSRKGGKVQGTRSYMSPEQIRGEPLDGRSDIYSFGCSIYEVITGRPPFTGASSQDLLNKHLTDKPVSPRIHNPDVTDRFAEFVMGLLAKKKEERPRDFHEVLMQMRGIRVFRSQPGSKSTEEEKPASSGS